MEAKTEVIENFRIPDTILERIKSLLPPESPKPKRGRPQNDDRQMMDAIFYVLRTGIQWKALPRSLAAPSSVHDRFQEWRGDGVSRKMWETGLLIYDQLKRYRGWRWSGPILGSIDFAAC